MTALSVKPPFPIFTDTAGQPLEDGFVYIGIANQDPVTNPITVYWDAALTIPATQPIRTLAGYPSRAGTPAVLYVNSDYSITVKNKNNALVYQSLSVTERVGSEFVTFIQSGSGAVQRTVESKLRDVVSVKDFGAVGDGIVNDRAAIQAAFDSGAKTIFFPSGTYSVGDFMSDGEKAIDLSALGSGISIITDYSVEIVGRTQTGGIPFFFYLKNNSHFYCGPIRFRDTNYNPLATWSGACAFYLDCDLGVSWGDLVFDAIYAKTMVAGMIINDANSVGRIRGISIAMLFVDDCYYGFNAKNNGDGVKIDNLIAYLNYRPYFVYGVTDHKVKIFNRNNRSTSGAVNISRSPGGLNTSSIDVTYVNRDTTANITHILINHIDLLGGEISNIKINLDIKSPVIYTPLRFVNYTGSGGTETNAPSLNNVYDITLSGSCDVQANQVTTVASYASKKQLNFQNGNFFSFDSTIPSLFYLDGVGRNTPVNWTATIANPSLGNGTLIGNYDFIDGICHFSASFTAGNTTTFGTGEWLFEAPYTASKTSVGSVWALDDGAAYYVGACKIEASQFVIQCYFNAAATAASSAVPFTWTTNDRLELTISFPIS